MLIGGIRRMYIFSFFKVVVESMYYVLYESRLCCCGFLYFCGNILELMFERN